MKKTNAVLAAGSLILSLANTSSANAENHGVVKSENPIVGDEMNLDYDSNSANALLFTAQIREEAVHEEKVLLSFNSSSINGRVVSIEALDKGSIVNL